MNRWARLFLLTAVCALMMSFSASNAFAKDASADIDQCANGAITALAICQNSNWVNGNLNGSKAHWFEGDSVPYRLKFSDLAPNTSYIVTIEWDTTKSGKHALDYITSYDRTETTGAADVGNFHLNQNDACSDFLGAGCGGAPSTTAIPTDPQVVGAAGQHPASQIPGVMTMWGATLSSILPGDYGYTGSYAGDSSTSLNITFTTPAVTNGLAVLAWGGHIATRLDWGANNSAIAISGSPYHMRLLNLNPPDHGGNQDRSLTADAVIYPASLTVTKDVVPDSNQMFDFTATGATFPYPTSSSHSSTFQLGDNGSITSDKIVFFPGSGTIAETQPTPSALWTTNVTCSYTPGVLGNGGSATPSTSTTTLNSAFTLNEGDSATCAYVNTFAKQSPPVSTTASAGGVISDTLNIHDTTQVGPGYRPTGTVQWRLYANSTCSGTPVLDETTLHATISNPNNLDTISVDSPDVAANTLTPGTTYHWVSRYLGDSNNNATSFPAQNDAACNDSNEDVTIDKASPGVSTTASAGGVISSSLNIHDTTQVGPGYKPTGTVQWRLYDNATCSGTPVVTETTLHATISNPNNLNTISVDSPNVAANTLTPGTTYHWVSRYLGDANNNATSFPAQNDAACNDQNEDVTIDKASPAVSTTASAGGVISAGLQIHDTTQVGPGYRPTGTVQWRLYDNATCSGTPVVTETTLHSTISNPNNLNTISVDSPNVAASSLTPGVTYHWVTRYLGDANNNATSFPAQNDAACNDQNEDVTISLASPPVSTTASAGGVISSALQIHDTTQVGPGFRPTGTVQWRLYANSTCSGTPVLDETTLHSTISNPNNLNTISVDSPNVAASSLTPGTTYHWVTRYLGDANNGSTSFPAQNDAACADSNEDVTIDKDSPGVSTTASAGGVISNALQIHDSTQVGPGYRPTGTVQWRLYDNATCSGTPVVDETTLHATISNPNNLNTISVDSPNVAANTLTPGTTYHWVSRYLGDANNNATSFPAQNDAACNDANEDVTIDKDSPGVSTTASAGGVVSDALLIHDTTDVGPGYQPTGTVQWRLYDNATCSGTPVVDETTLHSTISNPNNLGTISVDSPDVKSADIGPGTYHWVSRYLGDANNNATSFPAQNDAACADQNEDVTIIKDSPIVKTQVSDATIGLGHSVTDNIELQGGYNMAGQDVSVKVYGPNDPNCQGAGTDLGSVTLDGSQKATKSFTPTKVGHYTFVVSYAGDGNNFPTAGLCTDTAEQFDVVAVTLDVTKDPNDTHAYDGDKVSFTITAKNTGTDSLADVKVVDNIQNTSHACETLTFVSGDANNNKQLDPGETWKWTCTMTVVHAEEIGSKIVNVAHIEGTTVHGGDSVKSNQDDASVPISHPAIAIDKTGPATAQAGDKVGYVLTVTNPGDASFAEAQVTVADEQCNGDPVTLIGKGGDASPTSLDPGDTWTYSCSVQTAVGDQAIHNVGSVNGCDQFGKCVTASDPADTQLTQPEQLVLPERVVPGSAQLLGPTGCVGRAFNARVRGAQIATVTFVLDGKVVKKVKNTKNAKLITYRVNPKKLKLGVHRMVVNVTFKSGSGTKPRSIKLSFQRCGKKLAAPRFTG